MNQRILSDSFWLFEKLLKTIPTTSSFAEKLPVVK